MHGKGTYLIRDKHKNGFPDGMNLSTIFQNTENINYQDMSVLQF